MQQIISKYLAEIEHEFRTGRAREHSYRPALKKLIEKLNPDCQAINEPARISVGAPDFEIQKNRTPVGYIEAKDVDINLDEAEKSNQIQRYHTLNNLFLTNYLEFRFYLEGKRYAEVKIASVQNKKIIPNQQEFERLAGLLREFTCKKAQTITSANRLAQAMAGKSKLMKNSLYLTLTNKEQTSLHEQFEAFQKVLLHNITEEEFADVYAQTIAYGLFVARFNDNTPKDFSRQEAEELVPKSNPFLRKLFHHISGPDLDEGLVWIVDALADVFLHTDVKKILENFGTTTGRDDPIIHFYETFLSEYNLKLKKSRGVYYTPEPVVNFIVRSVNEILKSEFNLNDGLRNTDKTTITVRGQGVTKKEREQKKEVHKVQILDPAVGTGTFLNEVIKQIYKQFVGQAGAWSSYVDEHLLSRLHGFELMMAPYTMCHLKLGLTLQQMGYRESGKRLGVYLTNSLDEPQEDSETLFAQWLSEEANEASRVKRDNPIMVVLGNPPYSVSSSNKGEWIQNLIKSYKEGLNERNIQPLSDDYIKFLRYAQHFIDKNGSGVVAMITNNSFIDGITHRKMRSELLRSFDKVYIYDLHGNSKKKETALDGSKDENVFDIMQGVSINIFVKTSKSEKPAQVFHFDSYGRREDKYKKLWDSSLESVKWKKLKPVEPYFFFVPKDFGAMAEYKKGVKINEIFGISNSGIQTQKDKVAIQFTKKNIEKIIFDFEKISEEDFRLKYCIEKDNNDWSYKNAKDDVLSDMSKITTISYRPFDLRFTKYSGKKGFMGRARNKVMQHFIEKENVGLQLTSKNRQLSTGYYFVSKLITDRHLLDSAADSMSSFPLYLYPDQTQQTLDGNTKRTSNLKSEALEKFTTQLKLEFLPDGAGDLKKNYGPEDILDYIYAILHSPNYREKYKEFLKIDFPRIPLPKDKTQFYRIVPLGRELRQLHLMESPKLDKLITKFPVSGDCSVEKVKFENRKIWINATQYFEQVPEIAWSFFVGGYQPAQKWLKDRKGRKLFNDEIMHYQKIIVALAETDKIMQKIDKTK